MNRGRIQVVKNNGKRSAARWICRVLLGLVLLYLLAGLVPCAILPECPERGPEDWPASGEYVDAAMPVKSGSESLGLRLAMIDAAQEHIRLGTYLFEADTSGREVMAALYQAAERGVQVDILTDGILGVFNFHDDPLVYALGSHENVRIYLYNPVNLLQPWNLNCRYHEKYMVADGQYALLGGRNVSDEFLIELTEAYSVDLEVLIARTGDGVSVCDLLTERFDSMVQSPFCAIGYDTTRGDRETLRGDPVRRGTALSGLPLTPVRQAFLLGSSFDPGDKTPDVMAGLAGFAAQAEESLYWCSPYFCPDEPMLRLLRQCAELPRCVLITNSAATGNNLIASADGVFHRGDINRLPCEVWEVQADDSLHTKALLIDGRYSVVGSFNVDMRSAYLNTELMLVLDSPAFAERTRASLAELLTLSTPVSETAKAAGPGNPPIAIDFWKNLKICLLSPFAALLRFLI